jgi:hypothetical protein
VEDIIFHGEGNANAGPNNTCAHQRTTIEELKKDTPISPRITKHRKVKKAS